MFQTYSIIRVYDPSGQLERSIRTSSYSKHATTIAKLLGRGYSRATHNSQRRAFWVRWGNTR